MSNDDFNKDLIAVVGSGMSPSAAMAVLGMMEREKRENELAAIVNDKPTAYFPFVRCPEPDEMILLPRRVRRVQATAHKGEKEAARRRRQIERGILKVTP